MSEVDFFPNPAGKFRGTRYPGFSGGTADQYGNQQPVGPAANVSASTGNNLSPGQVQQQQVDKGNAAATSGTLGTPSGPSAIGKQEAPSTSSLGGVIAQGVLPAVGNIAGTAGGAVLGAGGSFGEALSAGGEALASRGSDILSGNFSSGLFGSSAGGAVAAGAPSITSAGTGALNVGVHGIDKLGTNAVSKGIGAGGAAQGASLGGSALSGIGTFAASLLSGDSIEKAAVSGIGSAAGAYIGSMILPGVGTVVGSFLGSMLGGLFGKPKPSVGPNAYTNFTVNDGALGIGSSGADNGGDTGATMANAKASSDAINKILKENNLAIDTSKLQAGQNGEYSDLHIVSANDDKVYGGRKQSHSAMDVWNWLLGKNAIVSKTPSAPSAVNNITTLSTSSAPVLRAGSMSSPGAIALTGAMQP